MTVCALRSGIRALPRLGLQIPLPRKAGNTWEHFARRRCQTRVRGWTACRAAAIVSSIRAKSLPGSTPQAPGQESHGITLSFHRKMADSSRELVGPDITAAVRLESYPRFIKGGFQDYEGLGIKRALPIPSMFPLHGRGC